ncbi:glycerol-3-phosphate acyltransferase [bacterium]|nr:glycerol-3-phosphate acyltransferase [bacterium]
MNIIESLVIPISVCILAYFCGLFSTARVLAKTFKYLNITKVGTGHADTKNIYSNVSKAMGVVVGLVDIVKIYLFLYIIKYFFEVIIKQADFASENHLFIYGFFLILGHCFPFYNKFKGGRGIFTFAGYLGFFAPQTMLIVGFISTVIALGFGQYRAAKYFLVGAPVIASLMISTITRQPSSLTAKILMASLLMIIVNFIVSRKRNEI